MLKQWWKLFKLIKSTLHCSQKFSSSINFCQFPSNCTKSSRERIKFCISCWELNEIQMHDEQYYSPVQQTTCLRSTSPSSLTPSSWVELNRHIGFYWEKYVRPDAESQHSKRKATTNFNFFSLAYTHSCLAAKHEHQQENV